MDLKAISICLTTELNRYLADMFYEHHVRLDTSATFSEAETIMLKSPYCMIVSNISTITAEQAIRSIEKMRKSTYAPILLLAPPELENDLINAGADRCISASATPKLITSVAYSLFRRYTLYNHYDEIRPMDAVLYRGRLVFDHLRHQVTLDDEDIHLTPKEYKLLYHFVRNPGIVFSADQICDRVWGVEFDENRDVTTVIAELRRKLKDTRGKAVYIKTVHGFGYQFLPHE